MDQGAASETGEERTSVETKWERCAILFKGGIYDICKGKEKREYADLRGERRRWLWLRIKEI